MRAAAGPWHRPSCPGNEAGTRHSGEQCHGTGLIQPSTSFPPGLSAACTKEGTPVCVQELLVFSPHRAAGQEQPLRTQHGWAPTGAGARGVPMSQRPSPLHRAAKCGSFGQLCAGSAWHGSLIRDSWGLQSSGETELGPSHATCVAWECHGFQVSERNQPGPATTP